MGTSHCQLVLPTQWRSEALQEFQLFPRYKISQRESHCDNTINTPVSPELTLEIEENILIDGDTKLMQKTGRRLRHCFQYSHQVVSYIDHGNHAMLLPDICVPTT